MLDAWNADIAVRREHIDRSSTPGYHLIPFQAPDAGGMSTVVEWRTTGRRRQRPPTLPFV